MTEEMLKERCIAALEDALEYSDTDSVAALVDRVVEPEGWAIFNAEDGKGEIQRDDEANEFASDDDAIAHVTRLAREGSNVHRIALAMHNGWRA